MRPSDARNWRKRMAAVRPPPPPSLWPKPYPLALPLPLTPLTRAAELPTVDLVPGVRRRQATVERLPLAQAAGRDAAAVRVAGEHRRVCRAIHEGVELGLAARHQA